MDGLDSLEICYYTTIQLNVPLPMKIHIGRVKSYTAYIIPRFDIYKYDVKTNSEDRAYVHTNTSFYSKFKEILQIRSMVGIIFDFLDVDTIEYLQIGIIPTDKEEFISYVLNDQAISPTTLQEAYSELQHYIEKVKQDFLMKAIEILEINKEYPEIVLLDDLSDSAIYKNNKEALKPNINQITLSTFIEFAGHVIFDENKGKACNEYSWREAEIRRLYIKKKSDEDNFIEKVRSKVLEEKRTSTQ